MGLAASDADERRAPPRGRARAGPDAVAAAEPQPEPSNNAAPVAVADLGRRRGRATGAARVFAASLHSGEHDPPRYGDYEAHRHWMEITYHLPVRAWYTYDTEYWGLDYPPLMAYIEKVLGAFSHAYDPASVALDASRGYEEGHHRAFMRLTVLVIDALVGVSAFVALAFKLEATTKRRALLIALCVLAPAPILVDHGARAASETRHRGAFELARWRLPRSTRRFVVDDAGPLDACTQATSSTTVSRSG